MHYCFVHDFHTLSEIKHVKAKLLSDGGQNLIKGGQVKWSKMCQFRGAQRKQV